MNWSDFPMGRFSVDVTIANNEDVFRVREGTLPPEKVRQVQIKGVVDTGAARLVLPASVVKQLGLPEAGTVTVRYADQREATRKRVKEALVRIEGREGNFSAVVEPKRKDALIGAIVLEELDLLPDCTNLRLRPRDPKQIIAEIE
jgi:predicted aspartyl protease